MDEARRLDEQQHSTVATTSIHSATNIVPTWTNGRWENRLKRNSAMKLASFPSHSSAANGRSLPQATGGVGLTLNHYEFRTIRTYADC
ncbi:hypothetical protein Trydic_g17089 [Trypoxylus dichotomus]